MAGKVTVTKAEMQQISDEIRAVIAKLDAILERPDTRPVEKDEGGWPRLSWESHDDPTYTGREIPPVEGLRDSGDDQ